MRKAVVFFALVATGAVGCLGGVTTLGGVDPGTGSDGGSPDGDSGGMPEGGWPDGGMPDAPLLWDGFFDDVTDGGGAPDVDIWDGRSDGADPLDGGFPDSAEPSDGGAFDGWRQRRRRHQGRCLSLIHRRVPRVRALLSWHAALVYLALLLGSSGAAEASDRVELSVRLDRNVSGCPDATAIRQRLLRAMTSTARDDSGASTSATVSLSRRARGYEATITLTGAVTGTRVITHQKTSCEAMIDAASVTLALMLDPLESQRKTDTPPPREEQPPPAAEDPAKGVEEDAEDDKAPKVPAPSSVVALDVGAGISRGILGKVTGVFGLTGRWLAPAPWSFGLGVFHQPLQRESAPATGASGGSVSVALSGIVGEGCFTALGRHAAMALDVCATTRFALVSGTAKEYPREGAETTPLLTLGPGLLWSQRLAFSGPGWGFWARGSVDVPIVRASYAVDGIGMVYNGRDPFFALSLGASLLLP